MKLMMIECKINLIYLVVRHIFPDNSIYWLMTDTVRRLKEKEKIMQNQT